MAKKLRRTSFNLSHEVKTSTDMAKLLPFFCEPIIPGDSFRISTEVYARFAPLLAPIMHRVNCYVHWFFVPNRLLWKDWKKFMTGGPRGKSEPVYPRLIVPKRVLNDKAEQWYLNMLFGRNSLYDYLGFPTYVGYQNGKYVNQFLNATRDLEVDLLPFMAYQRVWSDYYRDENLDPLNKFYDTDAEFEENDENEIPPLDSGFLTVFPTPENKTSRRIQEIFALRYRSWEKDYFTSALPWAQRGSDVVIPGTGVGSFDPSSLKIVGDGDIQTSSTLSAESFKLSYPSIAVSTNNFGLHNLRMTSSDSTDKMAPIGTVSSDYGGIPNSGNGTIITDLAGGVNQDFNFNIDAATLANALSIVESGRSLEDSGVDIGTINDLRRANALQQYLEAMARGGSRYIEQLEAIFGVRSSDARLQRTEYLGGGRTNVIISEVLQQSADTNTPSGDPSPLGEYAGRAVTSGNSSQVRRFFEEHGYLIGVMSIVPRSSYCQGLPRKYTKFDKYDYLIPNFAHLGEQEVRNSELYSSLSETLEQQNGTFGYQSRYAEYKFIPSRVTGEMRDRLDFWHLTRRFDAPPGLNKDFVTISPDETKRIYAVEEETEVDAATGEPVTDPDSGEIKTVPTDHIFTQIMVHCTAKRELPRYGTPKL